MKKIVIATNNEGKKKEIKQILNDFKLLTLKEINCNIEVEENEKTFEGNSRKKAKEKHVIFLKESIFSILVLVFPPPNAEENIFAFSLLFSNESAYSFIRPLPNFTRSYSSHDNSRSERNNFRNSQLSGLNQCTAAIKKASKRQKLSARRIWILSCNSISSISFCS